ncbi:MAG: D-psicose 3-epimerase [Saccharofermentanales bacterium]
MNKVGIYFAYWTKEWSADFHPYIDKVSSLGFDILEICSDGLLSLPADELTSLRDHAKDRKIELTFCVGFSPDNDPSSASESVRRAGISYAKRTLEAIARMDGKIFGGINYASWPASGKNGIGDKRPCRERSIRSMKEIIRTAEDYGIDYCVEVVNRFEQFLINTAEEAVSFVQDIDSPNAKILLDTFHMNIEEDSISQAIATAGSKLGHLHIGETNRKTPGLGHFQWDELMQALQTIGYKGHIVMEPFVRTGGSVGRDIKVWKDLSNQADDAQMDQAAQDALLFIRNKLAVHHV